MYIKSKIVKENFPTWCPCFNFCIPSFTHWVTSCTKFFEFRLQFIPIVEDFFLNFSLISEQKTLNLSLRYLKLTIKTILIFWYCVSFLVEVLYLTLTFYPLAQGREDNILIKYFKHILTRLLSRIHLLWGLRNSLLMKCRSLLVVFVD